MHVGESPQAVEEISLPSDVGARIVCSRCNVAILDHRGFDWRLNPTPQDHFAEMSRFAIDNGWGWEEKDDKWFFYCQRCVTVNEEALNKPLPIFNVNGECSKCGGKKIGVKFCTGRENCSFGAPRNHLHRMCRICGNKWIEGCLDDEKTFLVQKKGKPNV